MTTEIWEILDNNGKPTGETVSRDNPKAYEPGVFHAAVDAWIINSENKILIQKRSPRKKFQPNIWAMTGGNVVFGESPLNALQREIKEELGLELGIAKFQKILRYQTGNVWLDEYVIFQDVNLEDIILQDEEVSEVKFASYDEIEKLVKNEQFMANRWEFVREKIAILIQNRTHINKD